jgi:lipoate-protein ligase A
LDRGGQAGRPVRPRGPDGGGGVPGVPRGDGEIERRWRLIDSGAGNGPWNLALDESICRAVRERRSPPTLRLYRWSAPTLSVGCAQDLARDVDREACRARGVEIVRRISGGRAVLHDAELTYSVSAPAGLPGFGDGLDEAYRQVAAGLVAGLRLLGIEGASPSPGRCGPRAAARHPACFAAGARHEIEVGGRKLVGSAQRRFDDGFLQHGSILIEGHGAPLAGLLRGGAAADPGGRMVGLAELLRPCPGPAALVAAVAAGCAAAWGCSLDAGGPEDWEVEAARGLEAGRYRSEDWTAGRLPRGPAPR